MPGFRANKRRVRCILEVDSIPAQRQDLALPHRRRSCQGKERTHLTITFRLVPERTELGRRDDPITARRFRPLSDCCDGISVETSTLHGEVEDPVQDWSVVIHARSLELALTWQIVQECV